jgi:acetyl-CoA carboxylase biotin carboxyl carrier protein
MSDTPSEPSRTPEVETIRQLARIMKKYDLATVDIGEGAAKIRMRRGGVWTHAAADYSPAPAVSHHANAAAARAETPAAAPVGVVIESPMVGTFYASPAPDAAPYVTVGSVVNDKTTVCVIEAMKVFTDIPAGVSGAITEVLAKNGQPVEFGQPLFRVSHD